MPKKCHLKCIGFLLLGSQKIRFRWRPNKRKRRYQCTQPRSVSCPSAYCPGWSVDTLPLFGDLQHLSSAVSPEYPWRVRGDRIWSSLATTQYCTVTAILLQEDIMNEVDHSICPFYFHDFDLHINWILFELFNASNV